MHQNQIDETWGFVGKKQKNASKADKREGIGDVWTFVAVDAQIRMVATFLVPQRDPDHANTFIEGLASRLSHRVQLSSDSPPAYAVVVERGFGSGVDEGLIPMAQITIGTSHLLHVEKYASAQASPVLPISPRFASRRINVPTEQDPRYADSLTWNRSTKEQLGINSLKNSERTATGFFRLSPEMFCVSAQIIRVYESAWNGTYRKHGVC